MTLVQGCERGVKRCRGVRRSASEHVCAAVRPRTRAEPRGSRASRCRCSPGRATSPRGRRPGSRFSGSPRFLLCSPRLCIFARIARSDQLRPRPCPRARMRPCTRSIVRVCMHARTYAHARKRAISLYIIHTYCAGRGAIQPGVTNARAHTHDSRAPRGSLKCRQRTSFSSGTSQPLLALGGRPRRCGRSRPRSFPITNPRGSKFWNFATHAFAHIRNLGGGARFRNPADS